MNSFKVESLRPDTYFTSDLILDKSFILAGQGLPVTETLIKELKEWNFLEVNSEGTVGAAVLKTEIEDDEIIPPKAKPQEKDDSFRDSLKKEAEEANKQNREETRMEYAKKIYIKYASYINSVYRRYATHKEFNKEQLNEIIKELCVFIKDNRRFALRINPYEILKDQNFLIGHSMRSTVIAITIGLRLHMPFSQLADLGIACILHEIGMLKLPPQLYMTDKKLQPQEKAKLASHPILGYEMVKNADFPMSIQRAVLEHHEHENGSGYPRHIMSDDICTYAKIISVACSFEAISAPRHFREARSTYEAMLEMLQNQKRQYDEKVIKALLYSVSIYPIGVYVYLASGKVAQVCDTDPDNPKFPIVQILGERAADGDFRTVETTDEGPNKIIRVLNQQEVNDVLKVTNNA